MTTPYDAIARAIEDPQQTISLKIAPITDGGQASSQLAGGSGGSGGSSPTTAGAGVAEAVTSIVPQNKRLTRNPQLPSTPSGSYTDAEYEAALAQQRHSFQKNYLDVLQQLGFVDDQGNFVPGLVETAAARKRAQLIADRDAATRATRGDVQRGGATFSGRAAYRLSEAQRPFTTDLANLESDLPLQLNNLYEQATGLIEQFQLNMQSLLADAAARKAAAERARPVVASPSEVSQQQQQQAPPPPPPSGTFSPSAVATYDPTGILGLSGIDSMGSLAADRLYAARLARIGL